MLQGDCRKCRTRYYGWALRSQRNQYCSECGAALDITEDGETFRGYSPFEAPEYKVNGAQDARPAEQKRPQDSEKH